MEAAVDPLVEVVARAICKHCNYNPDSAVLYGGGKQVQEGPYGSVIANGISRPAWALYRELAEAILYDLREALR